MNICLTTCLIACFTCLAVFKPSAAMRNNIIPVVITGYIHKLKLEFQTFTGSSRPLGWDVLRMKCDDNPVPPLRQTSTG